MARQPLDPPSEFGRLVSTAIRREMGDRRMSGRTLARRLGKSEAYVRERLKDTYEFSLADVEIFALYIGTNPEEFIGRIERRELYKDWPEDERPMTAEQVRAFSDDLARKRALRKAGVGDSADDEPMMKEPPARMRDAAKKGVRKADEAPHAD